MIIGEWLESTQKQLKLAGVKSFYIDSLILAEHVTKKEREYLLAHPEHELSNTHAKKLQVLVKRRLRQEPIAYITGKCFFYGHQFKVNNHVLIPKPESEDFLNILKNTPISAKANLLDVGTGSGCLSISAKLLCPLLNVFASDNNTQALKIAKYNAKMLNAKVDFIQADMILPSCPKMDIILANLPYVPHNFKVSEESKFEPATAIFAGDQGLQLITKLSRQAPQILKPNGLILIESLAFQQPSIKSIMATQGFKLLRTQNLISVFSV